VTSWHHQLHLVQYTSRLSTVCHRVASFPRPPSNRLYVPTSLSVPLLILLYVRLFCVIRARFAGFDGVNAKRRWHVYTDRQGRTRRFSHGRYHQPIGRGYYNTLLFAAAGARAELSTGGTASSG